MIDYIYTKDSTIPKDILFDIILDNIDVGINIIDSKGHFIYYNESMGEIEGLKKEEVLGKFVFDVYPSINMKNSTLINCLKTGKPILNTMQNYLNNKGEEIYCVVTNIPIIENEEVKGVVEFSVDMDKIRKLDNGFNKWYYPKKLNENSKCKEGINYYTFEDFKTKNVELIKSIDKLKRISKFNYDVLIYGETGTGKEILAQSIHNSSKRKHKPFVAQNCAAIPENLLESIFFGTEKGSFTGAIDRPGLFEQADGGTLLLDELNSLPFYLQAKLLRVLQEGYIRRLGSNKDKKVDVRIIATVNEDPVESIKKNKLREDLFYRLGPIYVRINPLRERKEDIIYLTNYFIQRNMKDLNIESIKISNDVKKFFLKYKWRGNVRELKNVIAHTIINVEKDKKIQLNHLPYYVESEIKKQKMKEIYKINKDKKYQDIIINFEKSIIIEAIKKTKGNISEASKLLKIKRQTLQYKIKKYAIDDLSKKNC